MTNSLPMTWARRLTLLIGVPAAVSLIGWTGFHFVASAGTGSYPVSFRLPVLAGQVSADIDGGDLTLRPGTGDTAQLTGTVTYSLIRPILAEHSGGDGTRFSFRCQVPMGDCGLDATLSAPRQTAVAVSTGGGDLSISGFTSDIRLTTAGGDVTAASLSGRVQVVSGGGDIDVTDLASAQVSVSTAGGDVTLVCTRPPEHLRVVSGGGDVQIVLPRGVAGYNVQTSTGGGDISDSVPRSSSSPYAITVRTSGGNIDITQAS